MNAIQFTVEPSEELQGNLRVPGDKSISHRAIMLGAIAEGVTEVTGFLAGADTLATLAAFQAMAVPIQGPQAGKVVIQGVGLQGLKAPTVPLDLGNSGTSMRLMAGLMAGQKFSVEMTGDASLSRRPMKRVTEPLAAMGADIQSSAQGTPPLRIRGNPPLKGIEYQMPMASAQVKSALLLAGLYTHATTCIVEPAPTRDHTERMLRGFGCEVKEEAGKICLRGGQRLQGHAIDVPADISSAAFFIVGACIAQRGKVRLQHVGMNPTRTGILAILRQMGADIRVVQERQVSGEPVADIEVCSSQLHGIEIPPALVPLAIDEFPALFIAAACAQGTTILTGAEELRVKESDRIQVMAEGLTQLGVVTQPTTDGIIIEGIQRFGGGKVHSHGDHRVAMAFSMAALRAQGSILIEDCANVATSFPNFVALAQQVGLKLSVQQ